MCAGHSLHLKSEVTACVTSCPALYNSSTAFNMSHLATLRRGQHLYSKSVMECLPKMFAKLEKNTKQTEDLRFPWEMERKVGSRAASENCWERSIQ